MLAVHVHSDLSPMRPSFWPVERSEVVVSCASYSICPKCHACSVISAGFVYWDPSIAGAEPLADSALDMDVAQLAVAEDMPGTALLVVLGSCHRHWLA